MWCRILCVGIFARLSRFIHFAYIDCVNFVLVCVFVITLDAATMTKNRSTPFQSHHAVEFSLCICESSAGNIPMVVTLVCQFFPVLGKEEAAVIRKRSQ